MDYYKDRYQANTEEPTEKIVESLTQRVTRLEGQYRELLRRVEAQRNFKERQRARNRKLELQIGRAHGRIEDLERENKALRRRAKALEHWVHGEPTTTVYGDVDGEHIGEWMLHMDDVKADDLNDIEALRQRAAKDVAADEERFRRTGRYDDDMDHNYR